MTANLLLCRSGQVLVRLSAQQSCWVALPSQLTNKLLNSCRTKLPLALELRPFSVRTPAQGGSQPQPVYVGWAGESTTSPGVIEVPSALASCLSLVPGSRLQVRGDVKCCVCMCWKLVLACGQVRALGQLPRASTLVVEPASESDWELVELNAAFLELNMLQQASSPRHAAASGHRPLPMVQTALLCV